MPLMQKTQCSGKANSLEAGSFMFGAICGIWGLSRSNPHCPRRWLHVTTFGMKPRRVRATAGWFQHYSGHIASFR